MKIVFTASGNNLQAPLDSRFGRAPKLIVYDLGTEIFEVIDNQKNMNETQGAGIQAAETVASLGAEAIVTGHCGPKAFRVLRKAGIKIFNSDAPTVAEALELYRTGKLNEARDADVQGHWT